MSTTDNTPDQRADPVVSDQRIDEAPAEIKALFREYPIQQVIDALTAVGLNAPPKMFSRRQIEDGSVAARRRLEAIADAERILVAEQRKRQNEMLSGDG